MDRSQSGLRRSVCRHGVFPSAERALPVEGRFDTVRLAQRAGTILIARLLKHNATDELTSNLHDTVGVALRLHDFQTFADFSHDRIFAIDSFAFAEGGVAIGACHLSQVAMMTASISERSKRER